MERKTKNKYTKKTCSYKNPSYINVFCESLKTLHSMEDASDFLMSCTSYLFCCISTNNNILMNENVYLNISNYAQKTETDRGNCSRYFKKLINLGIIRRCNIKEIYTETEDSFQVYVFNPYIAQPPGSVDEHIYKLFDDTPFLNKESLEYKKSRLKSRERTISLSLRYDVLKRDNFTCQICGRTISDGAKLEVDHRVPVAKGGKSTMDNLWTLCFECNRGKSTKK